jgi:hypothetical protein
MEALSRQAVTINCKGSARYDNINRRALLIIDQCFIMLRLMSG